MNQYFTFTQLLGVRDSNLSPFRDARVKRYQSVQRMMDLIEIAQSTRPSVPIQALQLNPNDPQWDDLMPFPTIDRKKYVHYAFSFTMLLSFYAYNYNVFTYNIRYRILRFWFPAVLGIVFAHGYSSYRRQILKINLFDEYCYLRTQELVKQNQYLLKHEDFEKRTWWEQDFEETMKKIYRQGNDNSEKDFADSELLLQDFINRYVDPKASSPMEPFKEKLAINPSVMGSLDL